MNVVLGTGFYVDKVHPGNVKSDTIEALAEFMRGEIEDGCEGKKLIYIMSLGILYGVRWKSDLVVSLRN